MFFPNDLIIGRYIPTLNTMDLRIFSALALRCSATLALARRCPLRPSVRGRSRPLRCCAAHLCRDALWLSDIYITILDKNDGLISFITHKLIYIYIYMYILMMVGIH